MGPWGNASDVAFASWPIGSTPFNFDAQVIIDEGRKQKHFEAGVAIVLCPKKPEEMTSDDLCCVLQTSFAGIGMSVWRGYFLAPNSQQVSDTTHDVNQIESVAWHMSHLRNVELNFHVLKDDSSITFEVSSSDLPEKPVWHCETWTSPACKSLDVNFVVVHRIPVKKEHFGYPEFVLSGVVSSLKGYPSERPPPSATSISILPAHSTNRANLEITGANLGQVTQIAFDEKTYPPHKNRTESKLSLNVRRESINAQKISAFFQHGEWNWPSNLLTNEPKLSISPPEITPDEDSISLHGANVRSLSQIQIDGIPLQKASKQSHNSTKYSLPLLGLGTHQLYGTFKDEHEQQLLGYLHVSKHPCLLWDESGLAKLKARLTDAKWQPYLKATRSQADSGDLLAMLVTTSLYSDLPLRTKLLKKVRRICKNRLSFEFDATNWGQIALIYDTLFKELDTDDRQLIRGYLEFALKCYSLSHEDWFYYAKHNPSNTVAVSNASAGIVALALIDTHPDSEQLLRTTCSRLMEFASRTTHDDGGYIEGPLYWAFAYNAYSTFLFAGRDHLEANTLKRLQGAFGKMHRYIHAILGGDGTMLTFNDTQPFLTGFPTVAFLQRTHPRSSIGGLCNHLLQHSPDGAAEAFVFLNEVPDDSGPGILPPFVVLENTQLATFRSDSVWSRGMTVSIAGQGSTKSHHAQSDQGSVIVSYEKSPMLIDPGYYQGDASNHSILLVNGVGPKPGVKTKIVASTTNNDLHFISMDLSHAYRASSGVAASQLQVSRSLIVSGEQLVVIDDVLGVEAEASVTLSLQLASRPKQYAKHDSRRLPFLLSTYLGHELQLCIYGVQQVAKIHGPHDFGRSWIFRRMAEKGEVSWHSIELEASSLNSAPIVWTVSPPGQHLRIARNDDLVSCVFNDGRKISVSRRKQGGWNSDMLHDQSATPQVRRAEHFPEAEIQ